MLLDISDFMLQFVAGQDYCSCEGTQSRERIVYDNIFCEFSSGEDKNSDCTLNRIYVLLSDYVMFLKNFVKVSLKSYLSSYFIVSSETFRIFPLTTVVLR